MLSTSVIGQKPLDYFNKEFDIVQSWKIQGKHLSDTIPERPKYKFFKLRSYFVIRSKNQCKTISLSNHVVPRRFPIYYKPSRVILDNEESQFEVDLLGLDTSYYKEHAVLHLDDVQESKDIVFDSSKLFYRKNEDSSATLWWTYYMKEEDVTTLVRAKKYKP